MKCSPFIMSMMNIMTKGVMKKRLFQKVAFPAPSCATAIGIWMIGKESFSRRVHSSHIRLLMQSMAPHTSVTRSVQEKMNRVQRWM